MKESEEEAAVVEAAAEKAPASKKWDDADGVCYIDISEGHIGLTLGLKKTSGFTRGLKQGVRGAVVQALDPADNAAKAGIEVGCVIIGLDGKKVDSPKTAMSIINTAAGPTLEVQYVTTPSTNTAGG